MSAVFVASSERDWLSERVRFSYAPPDTVEFISESVLTAARVSDTDKTIKKTKNTQLSSSQ